MITFEEYLSEQFWKQYNGLDDESVEAEQDWLAELEPQDWIDYAQSWIKDYYFIKKDDISTQSKKFEDAQKEMNKLSCDRIDQGG